MLEASSIRPDDTTLYKGEDFINAIQTATSFAPQLTCYAEKKSDVQYLSQIQICINKNYEVMDCKDAAVEPTPIFNNTPQEMTCKKDVPIHYPTFKYVDSLGLYWKSSHFEFVSSFNINSTQFFLLLNFNIF